LGAPGVGGAIQEPLLLQALLECESAQRETFLSERSFFAGDELQPERAGGLWQPEPAPAPRLSVGGRVRDWWKMEKRVVDEGEAGRGEAGQDEAHASGKRQAQNGPDLDNDENVRISHSLSRVLFY